MLSLATVSAGAQQPTGVTARPLAEIGVQQSYRVPAEVVSLNRGAVSVEAEGIVQSVSANMGEIVEAGQVILMLDPADFELAEKRIQAAIASTLARIEQAKLRLSRARNLSEGRFVSADELLARETELSVLDAELRRQRLDLEMARRDIEKCRVVAPYRGVVVERQAQLGSYLRRGDPVVTLVDLNRFELEARLPGALLEAFEKRRGPHFAVSGQEWPVKLARLFPLIEFGERVNRARLTFTAGAPNIGSSGELRWHSTDPLLPAHLLVRREGQLGVFLAEGGVARFERLPGAIEGRPAAHALPASARIIVDGRDRLQDGSPIRLVN